MAEEVFPKTNQVEKPNTIINPVIKGRGNYIDPSAENVICFGDANSVGANCKNIALFNSSGCVVNAGVIGSTIINSSGVIVSEDNQTYVYGSLIPNAPKKVYEALLTQFSTNAPEATVNENTFGGTIVWSRITNGSYRGALAGAFNSSKTSVKISPTTDDTLIYGTCPDNDTVEIFVQVLTAGSFVKTDSFLVLSKIEITSYT